MMFSLFLLSLCSAASCILQLWRYRSTLQRCKCPICCRPISKLVPEASLLVQQEEDVIELLKKIERYNHLYVGGAYGFFLVGCYVGAPYLQCNSQLCISVVYFIVFLFGWGLFPFWFSRNCISILYINLSQKKK